MKTLKRLLKRTLFYLNTLILHTNYKHQNSDFIKINAKKEDCQFHISSNITIIITKESGEKEYFRIMSKHTSLITRLNYAVKRFFTLILNDDNASLWQNLILKDLQSSENRKKLLLISRIWSNNLKAFKTNTYRNFNEVGLPSLAGTKFDEHLCIFLKYMRGEISTHRRNCFTKNNQYENFHSSRQIATKRLADCLGVSELIPDISYCELDIEGYKLFGTLMKDAGGGTTNNLMHNSEITYEKTFFKEISNLEYFDSICYQPDHRKDNYSVKLHNRTAKGICAFDNDCPRTFGVNCNLLSKTYVNCVSVARKKGGQQYISRPYIDSDFYNKVFSVTKKELKSVLGNYLNSLQLFALWCRIKKFKKAANLTVTNDKNFLIDFGSVKNIAYDKSENMLHIDNLSYDMNVYGRTYLSYNLTVDEHAEYLERLEN